MGTSESEGQKSVTTGQITFDPNAVELFRDEFVRKGTLTPEQGQEVTSVLAEKGPQEAIQKLAAFLRSLEK